MAELAGPTDRGGPAGVLSRWWRRRGLRSRVTLTAAAGLLVAFAAADLLLFGALRISLTRSVDDTARSGATEVAALLRANRLPDPVPVAAGTITIQVLDSAGRITDASPGTDRLVPLLPLAQATALAHGGDVILLQGAPYDMPSLLRVAVVTAGSGHLVIAAVPYSTVSDSLSVVAKSLVIGTPVLFLAFTGAIWLVVGSTLRPIALLRRGASRVTATGTVTALPVPEARDEVRSLALTLNDMLCQLAAAQQRQRALVSDTAHELRSPIASIRTQLEVALDHPAGQDWAGTARDVLADTLRLSRLAEDLLLLARLDERTGTAGARPDHPRAPVDLTELSRAVVARYAGAPVPVTLADDGALQPDKPSGVHQRMPAGTGPLVRGQAVSGTDGTSEGSSGAGYGDMTATVTAPIMVTGDRSQFDRMLVNLIDNAVRYARMSVTVSVRPDDGKWAELTVIDDGRGVPEEDRERVFDRFTRLDDARSRDGDDGGGAGLGLAIVRATAQAYGGTAHLASRIDSASGLRAVVRFPLQHSPHKG